MSSPGSEAPVLRLRNIPVCEHTNHILVIYSVYRRLQGFLSAPRVSSSWVEQVVRGLALPPHPHTPRLVTGGFISEGEQTAPAQTRLTDNPLDTLPTFPISQWLQLPLCVVCPVQTSLFMRSF